jgi:hypothetical protein
MGGGGQTVGAEKHPLLPRVSKGRPRRRTLGGAAREGESPVVGGLPLGTGAVSTTRPVKAGGKWGGPPSKAKEPQRPIAESTVRER